MRMEKKYNLLDMILQKHEEHSSDWEKDNPVGSRNMKIQQSDYDTYGRSDLLKEARELEEQKLIKVKWMGGRSDMEYVQYRLEQMPRIYEMTGRIPKLQRVRSEQAADLKLVEWRTICSDPSRKSFKKSGKAWRIAVSVSECIREAGRACLYPDFQQLCPDRHKNQGL